MIIGYILFSKKRTLTLVLLAEIGQFCCGVVAQVLHAIDVINVFAFFIQVTFFNVFLIFCPRFLFLKNVVKCKV